MDTERVAECGRDVRRMTERILRETPRGEVALAELMAAVERRVAIELRARSADEPEPACRPGCATCCTVNVATLAVEGAAIAAFLRRRLGADEARRRGTTLLEFHARVRWLDDADRIRARLACPFLDERGACAIHPVRPLACRGVSSLDAADCRRALAERADDDGPGFVRMSLLQRAVHDVALGALGEALAAYGLDARTRDVSAMAGLFLADPARASAFAGGARLPVE
ncbi:YkgJ family cysteine cluster protein [Anaeromyxobacter oryzae]|uniref:Zinc/iron-chelating domain-containing protein n=1 Tax=Anaeromyxobacter oryzae TaxID=2918170 RepID=A0ABM7X139_9BACT|nr:YkgJ family cysteine cluster protein [Anaeromyxobacter oryzae]BDG05508.1 zinc/iron-chelating domain-containing protein [Anaeromyxobacter oryzae]